jgi:hypothetical protein
VLTEEGKRHIFVLLKLIFLCPKHFKLGVDNSDEKRSTEKLDKSLQ